MVALRCFALLVLVSSPALSSSLHGAASLVGDVEVCPDQRVCPDGNTCCQLVSGDYGCCQLPDAVCCSDKKSCCPFGTTCNLENGTCDQIPLSVKPSVISTLAAVIRPLKIRTPETPAAAFDLVPRDGELAENPATVGSTADTVLCPDGRSYCPDLNTCCLMPNHQWVCCPLPHAACCPDGFHCCPYGTRCDPSSTRCYADDAVATWLSIVSGKTPPQRKTRL